MLEKLGGRKFLAFLLIVLAAVLTHVFSAKGVSAELTTALLGALGIFSSANAIVTAKSMESTSPPAPTEGADDFTVTTTSEIAELKAQIEANQAVTAQVLSSVNNVGNLLVAAMNNQKPPPA